MDHCFGSGIHGILDSVMAANYTLIKSGMEPLFEWDTVSLDGQAVTPINGLKITPDYSLEAYRKKKTKPDIWIFPSVFHSSTGYARIEQTLKKSEPMIEVVKAHHARGGLLVSICSGSFLLAKSGLMDNHPALMHWKSEPHFHRMFPQIKIDTHQAIADYGQIISTIGGSMACEHLVMHLVKRFAGHRIAVDTAKLLMMDLNIGAPQAFRDPFDNVDHSDELVSRAQRDIEKNCSSEFSFARLSNQLNISDRQLNRRFKQSLRCSPLQYLQKIRLKRACHYLELTQLPSSKIVYEVGYQDESSFRRFFKKQMDMTMEDYRKQFGSRPQARH
ncbi:MAG: transcriptional regulator GlxA family with amidase domain [Gammaproteobacteria bacterium]|jgi:transcriptional regulator GlxA family with amidase domain